ncbi:MAG: DUF2202 domain-containing protein [Candidatus Saccharimonadales bacterium]
MKKINLNIVIGPIVFIVALFGVGGFYLITNSLADDKTPAATNVSQPAETKTAEPSTLTGRSTEELLLYLIEEEKLAHDVYTVMYQKYGANVFGNILQSESTHQGRVLTLLQARNIIDPRSSEIGVFKNQDLQALYNQLIEQGNKTATEAYNAGVAIEEKDIADIGTQLATATDQDVIDTLESLRNGSENHLRAFNKQLDLKF